MNGKIELSSYVCCNNCIAIQSKRKMHLKNETVTAEQQPDGRQHIDLNYYRYLLEQHNHDLPNHTKKVNECTIVIEF